MKASPNPSRKTGNVLIDFATVNYVNGVPPSSYGPTACMVRITEVTHDAMPQIVFDLAISLYSNTNVTYKDVHDLSLPSDSGSLCAPGRARRGFVGHGPRAAVRHLEFSADDARTYLVQSSTNLADWTTLGPALEDAQRDGEYSFDDAQPGTGAMRYYRVVTQ